MDMDPVNVAAVAAPGGIFDVRLGAIHRVFSLASLGFVIDSWPYTEGRWERCGESVGGRTCTPTTDTGTMSHPGFIQKE